MVWQMNLGDALAPVSLKKKMEGVVTPFTGNTEDPEGEQVFSFHDELLHTQYPAEEATSRITSCIPKWPADICLPSITKL